MHWAVTFLCSNKQIIIVLSSGFAHLWIFVFETFICTTVLLNGEGKNRHKVERKKFKEKLHVYY